IMTAIDALTSSEIAFVLNTVKHSCSHDFPAGRGYIPPSAVESFLHRNYNNNSSSAYATLHIMAFQ
ncbi:hypothetical protein QUH12_25470, partial [Klebsiella pneumoniae]|nr:hypothetical protein [Klebsiella pneumoniae]